MSISTRHRTGQRPVARMAIRALAVAVTAGLAVGSLVLPSTTAEAAQGPGAVADDSTMSITLPSGVTTTAAITAADGASLPLRTTTPGFTAFAQFYNPVSLLSSGGVRFFAVTGGRMMYDGMDSWQKAGDLTLSFSQPVVNPRLHFFSLGSGTGSESAHRSFAPRITLTSGTPATPQMASVSDWAGWTVTDSTIAPSTNSVFYDANVCVTSSVIPDASPFGCGSVELEGTVDSVTMSLESLRHQAVGEAPESALREDSFPYFYVSVTVDEDLAGGTTAIPATYGNASHVLTGLSLGESVSADAQGTASKTAPVAQATDDNDALSSVPSAKVGEAYTLSGATVNGLRDGHSATTSLWVDGNRNGTFDSGEKVSVTGGNGTTTLTVPASAFTSAGDSWLRLRTTENAAQAGSPTGFADSGEVEDWAISVAPASAPTLTGPVSGTVSGTATPTFSGAGAVAGLPVEVRLADGTVVCSVVAGADGSWTCPSAIALADGANTLTAHVVDAGGTSSAGSAPVTITVDTEAPAAVDLRPTNGTSVSGGPVEATDTVVVTDASGVTIPGTTTVNSEGIFTFVPTNPLAHGTVVTVAVTDAAGNVGPAASVTVDTSIPAAPVVNPTNGGELRGSGTPGDTVTATLPDNTTLTVTVQPDGSWVIPVAPAHTLTDGESIRVVATNPAGTTSAPVTVVVDRVAPDAPSVSVSNGQSIVIDAVEDCATVAVVDGAGQPIPGDFTVNPDGTITFVPTTPLTSTDTVQVIVTDSAGNVSESTTVTIDTVAPNAPSVEPSNGSVVRGTAEKGATVTVRDADGTLLGTATANDQGEYELSFSPAVTDGTVLQITATDAAGNESAPGTVRVDGSVVAAPYVAPTTGDTLSGTALPGGTVTVTLPDNTELTVVVGSDGSWTLPIAPAHTLTDGDTVTVTVANPSGTASEPTTVTVDRVAPAAPVVNPTDGTAITGGGLEPGGSVIVLDSNGEPVSGDVTVNPDGTFTFVPKAPLADGEQVEVIVTDAAGNRSDSTTVTVDAVAPAAPVVNPTDGSHVTGTAEPGTTVTVRDEAGRVIGTGTTGSDGRFDISLSPAPGVGEPISITVSDAAGNSSTTVVTVAAAEDAAGSGDAGHSGSTGGTDGTTGSTGSDVAGDSLAVTGAGDNTVGAALALLVLIAGLALVAARRPRGVRDASSANIGSL